MNKILILIGIIGIIGGIYLTIGGSGISEEAYLASIAKHREEKDQFMNTSNSSPFGDTTVRIELSYFKIDPKYRVIANVERLASKSIVVLGNSDGTTTEYLKYAYLVFEIDGTPQKLVVLKNTQDRAAGLSTLFTDATSGNNTYGGGRYLDLDFKNANQITLDFNLAYSPYCMYNENYSCPLPPRENVMTVAIRAGEKVYEK